MLLNAFALTIFKRLVPYIALTLMNRKSMLLCLFLSVDNDKLTVQFNYTHT
jgi:hypothetical protein